MSNETEIVRLFKIPDSETMVELAIIIIFATGVIYVIQEFLPRLANQSHGKQRLNLLATAPLLRLLIIMIALSLAIPKIVDPSMQNMIALLGTVGLALGFALKDYVSSLIAGIVAIGEKPYRNGDWIEIAGVYGEVRHIGMRTLHLVTPDDNRVVIPHALLWTEKVVNANDGAPRLQCVAEFYLHPQHDPQQVKQILYDVALTSAYLYIQKPIGVVVREIAGATHYRIRAYPVDISQQSRFISDLTIRGKIALQRCGIAAIHWPILSEVASESSFAE